MAQVDVNVVTAFRGLDLRGRGTLRTERANLDTPRELVNFHIDENDQLYMPPANATSYGTVTNPITQLIALPGFGVLVRTTHKLYLLEVDSDAEYLSSPVELLTFPDTYAIPIWANNYNDYFLFGYSTRGALAAGGGTWKVEPDGLGGWTVTDVSSGLPDSGIASYSAYFKGRRFVVSRGKLVSYSDLNDPLTFSVDAEFNVGGDGDGADFLESLGVVQGMTAWEDVLVIFMRSSVWLLTGTTPETFNLRQVQTTIGSSAPFTLTRVEEGLLRYHQLRGDPGIYVFSGTQSKKISDPVDPLFFGYSPNEVGIGDPYTWQATQWDRRFYLSRGEIVPTDDGVILVYDLDTQRWTTFDGFSYGAVCAEQNGMFFSVDNELFQARTTDLLPRISGQTAKFTLGYFDQGNAAGHMRFIGAKLIGRKSGTGNPTVVLTSTVEGGSVVSASQDITAETFETNIFPINLRGPAIELEFVVTPANDDNELVIEQVQLITSRKGEKVTRE